MKGRKQVKLSSLCDKGLMFKYVGALNLSMKTIQRSLSSNILLAFSVRYHKGWMMIDEIHYSSSGAFKKKLWPLDRPKHTAVDRFFPQNSASIKVTFNMSIEGDRQNCVFKHT